MKWNRTGAAAAVLACLLLAALAAMSSSTRAASWDMARATVAGWNADGRFTHCTLDARIECEPGAEAYAKTIAPLLPVAIARVERVQRAPFAGPVRVRVYATQRSYSLYSGGPGGAAKVSLGMVHVSPTLRARPDWMASFLAHELSHLHLGQRAHYLAMLGLPHWFREGYATWVSDGGGANGVARDQAAMMVDYLARRDRAAFDSMLDGIVAGKRFGTAVRDAYGEPMERLWADFLAELRADPVTRMKVPA